MSGRPPKNNAEFFLHLGHDGKTIFLLDSKFGNDGYATWFRILQLLTITDNHYYDCNKKPDWLFLVQKCRITEIMAEEIIQLLIDLEHIDKELWEKGRIIWVQALVDNFKDLYKKRKRSLPTKPKYLISDTVIEGVREFPQQKLQQKGVSVAETTRIELNRIELNRKKTKHTPLVPSKISTEKKGKKDGVCVLNNFEEGLKTEQSTRPSTPAIVSTQAVSVSAKCVETKDESDLFNQFWNAYPARRGVKNGKPKAIEAMYSLSLADQELVLIAVDHYAQSPDVLRKIGIRDPVNFFKDDYWRGFIDKIEIVEEILPWEKNLEDL